MASPTYVRGYLRAYSKKLDLNPDIVLKAYEDFLKDQKKTKKVKRKKKRKQRIPVRLIKILLLISVIFSLVFFFLTDSENRKLERPNYESSKVEEKNLNSQEKNSSTKNSNLLLEAELGFQEEDININNLSLNNINPKKKELDVSKASLFNSLRITFSGECWIEIYEEDSLIEYRLFNKGEKILKKGIGPFKVILGHSENAELFFNEVNIDLSSTTNDETNVSCLVLPKGRCSEFTLPN